MKRYLLIAILIAIFLSPIIWMLLNLSFSESFDCKIAKDTLPIIGKDIEQSFAPSSSRLSSIAIKFVTYEKIASGKIFFEITDSSQNTLFSKNILASKLKDNSFYNLKIPSNLLKEGTTYSIKISNSKSNENPAGLTMTESDCYLGKLQKDNKEIKDADIIMHLRYSDESFLANVKKLIATISLFKPVFLKDWGLVIIFSLYVSSIILTIIIFFRKVF